MHTQYILEWMFETSFKDFAEFILHFLGDFLFIYLSFCPD